MNQGAMPAYPEWRPIETVPKDGRGVLLCWGHNWEPSCVSVMVAEWWENEGEDDGEWVVYCDLPSEPRLHFEPTHWMPLPAPPALSDQPTRQEDAQP